MSFRAAQGSEGQKRKGPIKETRHPKEGRHGCARKLIQLTLSLSVRGCLLIPLSHTFAHILLDDQQSMAGGEITGITMGRLLAQPVHLRLDAVCTWSSVKVALASQVVSELHSCRPWCLRNFHHLGCHRHPLFPIILVHVNFVHVPVPCHSSSTTLQLLHILLLCSFQCEALSGVLQLTYATSSLVHTASVSPVPLQPGQFLDGHIHFLFKEAGLEYFMVLLAGLLQVLVLGLGRFVCQIGDGSVLCLNIFSNSATPLLPQHHHHLHHSLALLTLTGDSQYFKLGEVYCITSALDGYVMLLDGPLTLRQ